MPLLIALSIFAAALAISCLLYSYSIRRIKHTIQTFTPVDLADQDIQDKAQLLRYYLERLKEVEAELSQSGAQVSYKIKRGYTGSTVVWCVDSLSYYDRIEIKKERKY